MGPACWHVLSIPKMFDAEYLSKIAAQIVNEQTVEDLRDMQLCFGEAFDSARLCGMIVAGMIARVFELPLLADSTMRNLTPINVLVETALQRVHADIKQAAGIDDE